MIGRDRGDGCKRDFVVTVYERDGDGEVRPILPGHCPFGGDGQSCRVGTHCRRERQHGPDFALVIAVCHAHGRYFTLYPLGWTPWSRVRVQATTPTAAVRWESTVFVAALDAAAGRLWPVESVGATGCAKTQLRWIRRCGQWLGLAGSERTAEVAAAALDLPLTGLLDARRAFVGAGRRDGAAVVERTLRRRAWVPTDLRRLLVVGGRSGVCGRAWLTDPGGVSRPVFPA